MGCDTAFQDGLKMFCIDKTTLFWEHWVNPVVGPDTWIGPAAVRW